MDQQYNQDYSSGKQNNYSSMGYDQSQVELNQSSQSNGGYFNRPAPPSSQQNYSNNFWGRNSQSQGATQASFTPLTTAGSSTFNNEGALETLKMQLKIKESQIETLESDVQRLTESLKMSSGSNTGSIPNQVPSSLNEVFVQLSLKYNKALEELENTKLRLESLVTAITLNPSNNVTNNGRYDELEVSHKILIKLDTLKRENEELMKQLSFGKVKQMEMEMKLLKNELDEAKLEQEKTQAENQELKKRLTTSQK